MSSTSPGEQPVSIPHSNPISRRPEIVVEVAAGGVASAAKNLLFPAITWARSRRFQEMVMARDAGGLSASVRDWSPGSTWTEVELGFPWVAHGLGPLTFFGSNRITGARGPATAERITFWHRRTGLEWAMIERVRCVSLRLEFQSGRSAGCEATYRGEWPKSHGTPPRNMESASPPVDGLLARLQLPVPGRTPALIVEGHVEFGHSGHPKGELRVLSEGAPHLGQSGTWEFEAGGQPAILLGIADGAAVLELGVRRASLSDSEDGHSFTFVF